MKIEIMECPECGESVYPEIDDLEGETFSGDAFIQTWRFICPECGIIFNVTDTFTLTDRTYKIL